MKLLQVISSFPPAYSYGGALNVAYNLSKELVNNGHDVTVFTTDAYNSSLRHNITSNPEIMDGIKVFRFRNISNTLTRKNFSCAPLMLLSIKKTIKNFDIIHLHEYRSFQAIFVHYYAKKYQIPYILQPHGSLPRIIEKQNLKSIYDALWGKNIVKNACKIVAVSNNEVEQFRKAGVTNEKIIVIPNGIQNFSPLDLPNPGHFREQYCINEKHIIAYVGRIHRRKGIDFLIRAFKFFILTWTGDNVILVIIGPDGGELSVLKGFVDQIGLTDKVKFIGLMSPLVAAYQDADLLVYPSIYEIFGLVPFEALLQGTPVIVTDDCGCGEFIKKADCGYLVRYGDVVSLGEKIRYALEHPDENQKKVAAGQKYIKENLIWDKVVKQFEKIYDECILLSRK